MIFEPHEETKTKKNGIYTNVYFSFFRELTHDHIIKTHEPHTNGGKKTEEFHPWPAIRINNNGENQLLL